MLVIPAIDIRQGAAVQLVGGDFSREAVHIQDPRDAFRAWTSAGFRRLHLVDLDAATARGSNLTLVRDLLDESLVPVQAGGGVRTTDHVDVLLSAGAGWVVVGTRAVTELDWLEEISGAHPGAIIVAADVRDRRLATHGWAQSFQGDVFDLLGELSGFPLGGLLVTAVQRQGRMPATDLPLLEDVAEVSAWPVFASGGVATMADLRALEDRGLAGAVIGMALHTGTLDPTTVAAEFAQ